MNNIIIYFDEEAHKYTDNLGNPYTSNTQVYENYYKKFDKKKMANVCAKAGMKGNPKYAGKTAKQIMAQWDSLTVDGQDKGNVKHDYFDGTIKQANSYSRNSKGYINGRIYTVADILTDHSYGKVDISVFRELKLDVRYPKIYQVLDIYASKGWNIYSEIGVFDTKRLISGLIDVLLVRDDKYIIIDWKTNKDPIAVKSGYYNKNFKGERVGGFVETGERFYFPIGHLETSTYNKYLLQVGTYDVLVAGFGLTCETRILFHIITVNGVDQTIPYILRDV